MPDLRSQVMRLAAEMPEDSAKRKALLDVLGSTFESWQVANAERDLTQAMGSIKAALAALERGDGKKVWLHLTNVLGLTAGAVEVLGDKTPRQEIGRQISRLRNKL
jgi:hypothetical protein